MMSVTILRNHRPPFALFYQGSASMSWNYLAKDTVGVILCLLMASLETQAIDISTLCRLRLCIYGHHLV